MQTSFLISSVRLLLKGMAIGVANIIPGVSGGTMALVLGIYDRLIQAIGRFRLATLGEIASVFRGQERGGRLGALWRHYDLGFITLITLGALAAIALSSGLMTYLLDKHHAPTYGFFFGLVGASVAVPCALLKRRSWRELVCALLAIILTVSLSNALSSDERLQAEREKAALSEEESPSRSSLGAASVGPAATRPSDLSPRHLLFLFFVGAVAISAMILPGISGSFILLVLGAYFEILLAVHRLLTLDWRSLPTLGAFGLGCVLGIVLFARLLAFLLERYYSPTMAFLAGLMLGSLWNLWPFKEEVHVGSTTFHLDNTWPVGSGSRGVVTAITLVLGAAIAFGFFLYERSRRS